jgi:hypothetical protein
LALRTPDHSAPRIGGIRSGPRPFPITLRGGRLALRSQTSASIRLRDSRVLGRWSRVAESTGSAIPSVRSQPTLRVVRCPAGRRGSGNRSTHSGRHAGARIPASKLFHVPNGVDVERFIASPRDTELARESKTAPRAGDGFHWFFISVREDFLARGYRSRTAVPGNTLPSIGNRPWRRRRPHPRCHRRGQGGRLYPGTACRASRPGPALLLTDGRFPNLLLTI